MTLWVPVFNGGFPLKHRPRPPLVNAHTSVRLTPPACPQYYILCALTPCMCSQSYVFSPHACCSHLVHVHSHVLSQSFMSFPVSATPPPPLVALTPECEVLNWSLCVPACAVLVSVVQQPRSCYRNRVLPSLWLLHPPCRMPTPGALGIQRAEIWRQEVFSALGCPVLSTPASTNAVLCYAVLYCCMCEQRSLSPPPVPAHSQDGSSDWHLLRLELQNLLSLEPSSLSLLFHPFLMWYSLMVMANLVTMSAALSPSFKA